MEKEAETQAIRQWLQKVDKPLHGKGEKEPEESKKASKNK
jgi:hypothetical protein